VETEGQAFNWKKQLIVLSLPIEYKKSKDYTAKRTKIFLKQ
jgi:hypothetical protein